MVRDGKPKGFFYLDHRTVDGKFSIITDSFATPANVHDSIPYPPQKADCTDLFYIITRATNRFIRH